VSEKTERTLVAGVGNVFLRDDAFGVEVVRLMAGHPVPEGVQIRDYGIRGVHLVYDLLNGCDLFVLVDAAARGEAPGTVSVIEAELPDAASLASPVIDAHSLAPDDIFALLASLGGRPGRSVVVACEPADVSEGMGLSEPVREALPHAVRAVEDILAGTADLAGNGPGRRRWDGAQDDKAGAGRRGAGGRDRLAAGPQAIPGNPRDVKRGRESGMLDVAGNVAGNWE
jgi:hydrogenase maturation protease